MTQYGDARPQYFRRRLSNVMKVTALLVVCGTLSGCIGITAMFKGQAESHFERVVALESQLSRVDVKIPSGRIYVSGDPNATEVTVEGVTKARGWSDDRARTLLDSSEVHVQRVGDTVIIETTVFGIMELHKSAFKMS